MHLDRIEESLLVFVALALLSFLWPFYLPRILLGTLLIATALIIVLLLRSRAWHHEQITPYDWIIIAGVAVTLAYLVTFLTFTKSSLSVILVILFAGFYGLMAVLLMHHRGWLFGEMKRWASLDHDRSTSRSRFSPSNNREKHRFFFVRRKNEQFKEGVEPIPSLEPYGHDHESTAFRVGIEPLHELEVYDAERGTIISDSSNVRRKRKK